MIIVRMKVIVYILISFVVTCSNCLNVHDILKIVPQGQLVMFILHVIV